jgi:hypothetical protein
MFQEIPNERGLLLFDLLSAIVLTAQINEALCNVLCHNLCVVIQSVHELGIETDFGAALP